MAYRKHEAIAPPLQNTQVFRRSRRRSISVWDHVIGPALFLLLLLVPTVAAALIYFTPDRLEALGHGRAAIVILGLATGLDALYFLYLYTPVFRDLLTPDMIEKETPAPAPDPEPPPLPRRSVPVYEHNRVFSVPLNRPGKTLTFAGKSFTMTGRNLDKVEDWYNKTQDPEDPTTGGDVMRRDSSPNGPGWVELPDPVTGAEYGIAAYVLEGVGVIDNKKRYTPKGIEWFSS